MTPSFKKKLDLAIKFQRDDMGAHFRSRKSGGWDLDLLSLIDLVRSEVLPGLDGYIIEGLLGKEYEIVFRSRDGKLMTNKKGKK